MSTAWAGGVTAVVEDHRNNHVEDTLKNGHDICDLHSVQEIIEQGKKSIDLLSKYELDSTKGNGTIRHWKVVILIEELFITMITLVRKYIIIY